ncbi:MAG: AMP-binding protein [Thiohalocapsa sp.]
MNRFLSGVLRHFQEKPDAVFSRFIRSDEVEAIRWCDLEQSAAAFLAAYRAQQLPPDALVLIFLRHVPALYGSFLGAMLGGLRPSYMPCASAKQDPALYWSSHATLFERIVPALVVADRATLREMQANGLDLSRTRTLAIDDVEPSATRSGEAAWSEPEEDAIGLLQHSSGTTGLKKGVALSYRAIAAQLESYGAALGIAERDVIVSWLPLYHDMGLVACLLLPLYKGVPLVHLDPFDWLARPGRLFEHITRWKGTLAWLPNFAFDHLAAMAARDAGSYDLTGMRAFINCSEPCRAASFDRFLEAFASAGARPEMLQCCYAMAETVFAVSQTELSRRPRRIRVRSARVQPGGRVELAGDSAESQELVECGAAIDGIRIDIYDAQRARLPEGHVGEIGLSGEFLFAGYNADPARTLAQLCDGVYFTRDLGFVIDGAIFVLGRIDDLIIVNGRNVYAHEIEDLLREVDGLKPGRSVALPWSDERVGSNALIVVAEKLDGSARPDSELRAEAARRVFSVTNVMPRTVHLVAEGWLVKTTSGKISRAGNAVKLAAMLTGSR